MKEESLGNGISRRLCFALVVLIHLVFGSCKAKVDRDLAYCRSHAFLLAAVATGYKEQYGSYPPSFTALLEDSEVKQEIKLPDSGESMKFVYGVEGGHDFLFATSRKVGGWWVVYYPGGSYPIVTKTSPFADEAE
jgi:hypothetical protein